MKKILFVITKSNWGGAQRYVFDMAVGLKNGFGDQYVPSVALGGNGELAQRLKEAGIPVYTIPSLNNEIGSSSDVKAFFEISKIISDVKPAIVHLNSSKIGALGALAARTKGVRKIIFTAHGWAFNEDRSSLSKSILKFIYWTTMMLSHHTIAVSEATKKYVSNWPCIGSRISVVHNAVEAIDFLPREEARAVIGLDQESWVLGTIAELHPIKGLIYACQAVADLSSAHDNVCYAIIGEGKDRPALEAYTAKHHLENTITFAGHISQASRYLKAFDAFILPSLSEGLGYVILEAGVASLPVVASDVGGIPEIITDDISGLLVPARDTLSITHALETLYNDKKEADALGAKLNEEILVKFSMETMLEKTAAFYN